ncbi:putative HTH-type transcriptional regulator [Pseudomonas fluorescens]|nr:putative HTH-type transcriptional regulator [Pseudomonas fluorescens]
MPAIDTIATRAQAIARALEAQGIAAAPLLREAGISHCNLHDSNQRIALASMSALWRAAQRITADECFGLRVAQHSYPTDFHGLCFAAQSSTSVGEALERGVRFAPVISTSTAISLERSPGTTRLIYALAAGAEVEQVATEASIAYAVNFSRQTWVDLPVVQSVQLTRPAPKDPERWARLIGCPVNYGASENAIEYSNRWLDVPLGTANPEVAKGLDGVLSNYLERQTRLDLPERVRALIGHYLPIGEVQQSQIAAELGMSARNMHRHLLKHDTSFKALLDDCRRQLAFSYLRQSQASITEICYRLGFNEQSSFNRAFRRWTGASPGKWRRDGACSLPEPSSAYLASDLDWPLAIAV